MPLSDTAIKNAKAAPDKAFKMPDEKGMYLLVHQNGSKYFRFDYRFNGKRKTLALGVYPDTTLKTARSKRDDAREQIAKGIDPGLMRKIEKAGSAENTFSAQSPGNLSHPTKTAGARATRRTSSNVSSVMFTRGSENGR